MARLEEWRGEGTQTEKLVECEATGKNSTTAAHYDAGVVGGVGGVRDDGDGEHETEDGGDVY